MDFPNLKVFYVKCYNQRLVMLTIQNTQKFPKKFKIALKTSKNFLKNDQINLP